MGTHNERSAGACGLGVGFTEQLRRVGLIPSNTTKILRQTIFNINIFRQQIFECSDYFSSIKGIFHPKIL